MPQLSSANRSQLTYKLEGTYPSNFGLPQPGNGTFLNMTAETFDFSVKTQESKTIRADRSIPDIVQVGAQSAGGFGYEAQYAEYDPFIESVVGNAFTVYGTNGVTSVPIGTLNFTSTTITAGAAPTGSDAFTTLTRGQWFSILPPAGAGASVKAYFKSRAFRVSLDTAPTSTVITLHPATPIDTTKAGASLSNGKIGTSYVTNGNLMRSYTIEVGHGDISRYRQYTGMVPAKFDMKLSVGNIITGTFEFMGKSMNPIANASIMGTPVQSQPYTPANATKGVFDLFEGGQSISATTFIKSAEISIDGSLRMQDAVGVFGVAGVAQGTFKISGKLEVYFADEVMYNKLLDGSNSSLSIPILDVDGNGYVYHFPRIKYTAGKVNATGINQDNMLSMDFTAIVDQDAASPTYQKTVVISRVGVSPGAISSGALDTRPRFGLAAANAFASDPAALLAALTSVVPGSSNGGHTGTFNITTTAGNYGWLAVEATGSTAGVTFYDGLGNGGWSGSGTPGGNYTGSDTTPTTSAQVHTDGNGTQWRFYRQNYVHADPTGGSYTIS